MVCRHSVFGPYVLISNLCPCFTSTSQMHLSFIPSPVANAAVRSKTVVVLLLLIH